MDRVNLLRIANYEYYLYIITRTSGIYLPPHEILQLVEQKVCYDESPRTVIEIQIGNNEEAVFSFLRTERDGVNVYKVYDFKRIVCL